jgi:hypothetical protein
VFDLPVVGEKFRPLRNFSPKFEEEGLYNAELYEAEVVGVLAYICGEIGVVPCMGKFGMAGA